MATPEHLDLEPGAEGTVTLSIQGDLDYFQPGTLYEGVFRVTSPTHTLLELPLRIRVSARLADPKPADPAPSTEAADPALSAEDGDEL